MKTCVSKEIAKEYIDEKLELEWDLVMVEYDARSYGEDTLKYKLDDNTLAVDP